MAVCQLNKVVEHIRNLVAVQDAAEIEDVELLKRFVQQRDETAFEAVVRRHGSMVFSVCRHVLRDVHDAEDAFQATFLVLVRKASSLRSPALLGNWLYGVAHRTALGARKAALRRRAQEAKVTRRPEAPLNGLTELGPVLDQELTSLPDRYRKVIVLCDLEGNTRAEAARRLHCAEGTVASRLARGRAILAKRLARHGLCITSGVPATAFLEGAVTASVPAKLVGTTVQAANLAAAGKMELISVRVVALMEGVVKVMLLNRLKNIVSLFLAIALIAGVGLLLHEAQAEERPDKSTFPIYLHPSMLAEAQKPSTELGASGGGFWMPGPERLYGWALRDLHDCLQRMTGSKYPLTPLDKGATRGVFAGTFEQFPDFKPQDAEARKAFASADPEAFVVEVQGERLFILGKTQSGLIAGIYALLDKLGCKWFAPGKIWENVPELSSVKWDAKLNLASSGPSYQSRNYFPSWGPNSSIIRKGERERDYALWNLRNRMGGSAYTANFHNDPAMVPPALFEKRPELFALIKGKRNSYALSRANPDTLAMATESAVKYLKENDGKGSYYSSFSVETNDGSPACEWSLEKIAAEKMGKPTATDLNYWFANQVAAGLEKAGLKDKWVGMCSYSDHAGIPSFDLHPRIGVQVTTGLDFSSGMTVEQRLDGLRHRKAGRLGLYHYLNLLTWSQDRPGGHPASDPLAVAADLKRWHEHGATSYMAETSDSWINGGAGHYLLSRVMWNVNLDPKQELDTYYSEAFGPAAAAIRALHDDWLKFGRGQVLPKISRANAARWHHLISTADSLVAGNAVYKPRINDIKRYYLYLDHIRAFDLDVKLPGVPSREERLLSLARYVGSNRGEGAFHAIGLLPTWLVYMPPTGVKIDLAKMGPEFVALAANITDLNAWKSFPPLDGKQIDAMFAAVKLPLDGPAADPAVLDPAVKVFPAKAQPPAEIVFPKLHGPPTPGGPRRYVLQVIAPTPKLTFLISAGNPIGGGTGKRTCTVLGDNGEELKRLDFPIDTPVTFELNNVKPGVYTALFPEFGAEQLTVRGGNTFGAVRPSDDWGFNPFRPTALKPGEDYKAYFLVPTGATSLKMRLSLGTVTLGFTDGDVIASAVKGSTQLQKEPAEFKFPASDKPRIAYAKWAGEFHLSQGMVIEGVTLFSPDPSYVLYESLEQKR